MSKSRSRTRRSRTRTKTPPIPQQAPPPPQADLPPLPAEEDFASPARAPAEPDIVLYICGHGTVDINQRLGEKILWHSFIPINGCVLHSSAETDRIHIQTLQRMYNRSATGAAAAAAAAENEILEQYCNLFFNDKKLEFFINFTKERIQGAIKSLEIIKYETEFKSKYKMFYRHVVLITEKVKKYYSEFIETNNTKKLDDIIIELKRFQEKVEYFRIKQDSVTETYLFYPEIDNIITLLKEIIEYRFMLAELIERGKFAAIECNKFRNIKFNKMYNIKNSRESVFGIYVLYMNPAAAAAAMKTSINIVRSSHVGNIFELRFNKTKVLLSEIIDVCKSAGFNNITVYDGTCNWVKDVELGRELSPIGGAKRPRARPYEIL